MPQPLVEALRAHRTAQLEERLAAGSCWWTAPAAPNGMSWDLVFRQPDRKPVGHKRDHAEWKALLADAGVRDARLRDARLHDARRHDARLHDARRHDARHAAASLLLLLQVPARVVVEMLCHSSYQLTPNPYSHVAPELTSEAAQLMAGALWDGDEAQSSGSIRRQPP